MVGNKDEYAAMNACEQDLWWYKALHHQVITSIINEFGDNKNIEIIDAGCGTGGLLHFLKSNGYNHLIGLDISSDAIRFSKEKGLNVFEGDVKDIGKSFPDKYADVIISNDMLYFFEENVQVQVLRQFSNILKPGGVCIMNLPAFDVLSGTHDVAVGIKKRFHLSVFQKKLKEVGLKEIKHFHWPFLLSPIILITRTLQRFLIKLNLQENLKSDVKMPPRLVNNILYLLTKTETKIPFSGFFGSSLFITAINRK